MLKLKIDTIYHIWLQIAESIATKINYLPRGSLLNLQILIKSRTMICIVGTWHGIKSPFIMLILRGLVKNQL